MSSPNPPYTITFLPPPGPAVLSLPTPDTALCLLPSPSPSTSPTSHPPASPSVPQPFHDAIAVRVAVFVTEQNGIVESEIDPDDPISFHWILYTPASIPAATVRLVPAKTHPDPEADAYNEKLGIGSPDYAGSELWDGEEPFLMLGRVATRREFRGTGYAKRLIGEAMGWAAGHGEDVVRDWRDEKGERVLWKGLFLAHAQLDKEVWYARMGWRTDAGLGRWEECGIVHVGMWRRLEVKG